MTAMSKAETRIAIGAIGAHAALQLVFLLAIPSGIVILPLALNVFGVTGVIYCLSLS